MIWALMAISTLLALVAGYLNHIIHTIQNEQFVLLLVGVLAFPIGIFHGIGLWFGLF
ncbi:hypothetical protein AB4259_02725 [Vibrio amylolyticus]|uniref:hypothetical protein n=1 Tax=Vibrio amylolyticus TaxID=2847292 RepID=UPI0035546469